ncbi:hypothetical protein J5A68_07725 [Prevotella melaninogenica]|uniref:hypothetical protein n=1 Tax=Prevotella melaninogenica TaxID=28132 RepID=UPI001BA7C9C8|nr:hypothetical protein [Prevotella melaninogenica]QUB67902.1 hypothetical protein J5A68_07725 [Prevotella melaninogenica]
MLTEKHKTYWIIRKLLGFLLLLEVVWLVINCVSPWRLWSNADIIVVCTLPWILLFFLIRYIKRRWKEDGNAAIGCLHTLLWMSIPLIIIAQLLFGWLWNLRNDSTKITFEDDKYQVIIIKALFATQMDKIQIMEHCGPFYHEVYFSELHDVDTTNLKSTAAIEDFLKKQKR